MIFMRGKKTRAAYKKAAYHRLHIPRGRHVHVDKLKALVDSWEDLATKIQGESCGTIRACIRDLRKVAGL